MVERLARIQKVWGSSPHISTTRPSMNMQGLFVFRYDVSYL